MKNILKCFIATALVLSGLLLFSCSDGSQLFGPADTWCKMDVNYAVGEKKAPVEVWFYYAKSNKTIGKTTIKSGLNIAVVGTESSNAVINTLNANAYILKNISEGGDPDISSIQNIGDFAGLGSRAKWTAIYYAKEDLRNPSNQKTSAPSAIQTGINLNPDDLKDFNWKTMLGNYILKGLGL